MALVLAIEPNAVQANTLRNLLGTRADTDVVVVASTDAAVAAIDERVPDLVLVGALLSPRDEDPFIAHLRTLPDAGHLQTLTIPQLRQSSGGTGRFRSIFSKRKKRRTDEASGGCDPTRFGDEIAADLARACEVKTEIEQRKAAVGDGEPRVADRPEPTGARSSVSAEGPFSQDARWSTDSGSSLKSAQDECKGVHHRATTPRETCTAGQAETAIALAAERADAERALVAGLTTADHRHGDEIARLESEAAADAQAAQTLAVELDRVRADAEQTLAAELDRVRADAERTLAAELITAEHRHGAELARLETKAAEQGDAAALDEQAAAQTLAAELDRVRTDAARTLAAEAQATQTLTAELNRVRADAARPLAAELAAAEQTHAAEMTRLETEAAESRAAATRDAQAHRARAEASHQATDRQAVVARKARAAADRDPQLATAPSTSISLRPLEPVHRDGLYASGVTDYYDLWRARSATNAPRTETGVTRPPRVDPRRRRWALAVAATLLILLTNNPDSGSVPRHAAAAAEAASVSHATRPLDPDSARTAPTPRGVGLHDPREPAAEDNPGTGASGRAARRQLGVEAMCVLAVMLLLRIALFVGEGLVWHGLVTTLGLVLLGFALMRAPWGG